MSAREGLKSELERIGRTIKGARAEAGLSQTDVARQTGVAASTLSDLENGSAAVRLDTLTKVAQVVRLRLTLERTAA